MNSGGVGAERPGAQVLARSVQDRVCLLRHRNGLAPASAELRGEDPADSRAGPAYLVAEREERLAGGFHQRHCFRVAALGAADVALGHPAERFEARAVDAIRGHHQRVGQRFGSRGVDHQEPLRLVFEPAQQVVIG